MEPLTIYCDESGAEGDNLLNGNTKWFSHGATTCSPLESKGIIEHIKRDLRLHDDIKEIKSHRILQKQSNFKNLLKILSTYEVLESKASISIVHKEYHAVVKFIDTAFEPVLHHLEFDFYRDSDPIAWTKLVFSQGANAFGEENWKFFLNTFINYGRRSIRNRAPVTDRELFDLIERMYHEAKTEDMKNIFKLINFGKPLLPRYAKNDATGMPGLDPLLPSVMATAKEWSRRSGGRSIEIVHDNQHVLTAETIKLLVELPNEIQEFDYQPPEITDIRLVDSASNPSIQIADIVAGIGTMLDTKYASLEEALNKFPEVLPALCEDSHLVP